MNEKAIYEAVGTLLKQQRNETDSAIADILKTIDDIKSVAPKDGTDGTDGVGVEEISLDGHALSVKLTNGEQKSFDLPIPEVLSIKSVDHDDAGLHLVLTDDTEYTVEIPKAVDGVDGVSVANIELVDDNLLFSLSDGEQKQLTLPKVEVVSVKEVVKNDNSVDIILTDDSVTSIEIPKSQDGVGISAITQQDDQLVVKTTDGLEREFTLPIAEAKNGVDGVGIKAVQQAEGANEFDIVFDNDEVATIALPEPVPGEKGDKGEDGIDRPIYDVRKASAGLCANEVCYFDGGLYQTTKQTIGTPSEDAGAYRLVLNGVESAKVEHDWGERKHLIKLRMTDGEETVSELQMMPGLVDEHTKTLLEGDYKFDDSVLSVYDGENWKHIDLRGKRGRTGRTGAGIKNITAHDGGLRIFTTDEKAYDVPIVESVVELLCTEYKEVLIDLTVQTPRDIDAEIRRYSGIWVSGQRYNKGDVVTTYQGLYLALKDTSAAIEDRDDWAFMLGIQASGAGGGGGGGAASWPPIVTTSMDMQNFNIQNLRDPRSGVPGQKDAVSKEYMEKAIAAGALYQGIYTVETNTPDLHTKADVTYTFPTANSQTNKPAGTAGVTPTAGNTIVWFDITAGNLHATTWPHTLTVPLNMEIRFSNGEIHKFAIPVGTYATWLNFETAIITEINSHAGITNTHFKTGTTELWVGVETTPPLYATFITDQVASPFPAATPGTNNSILNTYNWVIQTKDENTPEALPPGIPGIAAGTVVKNSDLLQWSAALNGFEIISGSSLTQSYSDQRYWQINSANFAWADQQYNTGAVVLHNNAWWQATQNIPAGSAEPGSVAAAAIWNQVNNSFGSRTFYGIGDFDPTDTTAANNWGMPTGTTPAGVQPLDGDAYFDVTSGSVTDFTVFTPPPVYVITGVFDVAASAPQRVGTLSTGPAPGQIDATTFNVDAAALGLNPGDNYYWQNPATTPITAGHFTGMSLAAGDYYFVYVGDPDAQDGGWVIINDVGTGPYPYTLPTPHAQVVPDNITGTTTFGYRRNFEITFDATVVDDSYRTVLKNFAMEPASFVVEIQDEDTDGSYYKFELTTARSVSAIIAPITFIVHDDHILSIGTSYNAPAGGNPATIDLCVKLNASGANVPFRIVITSEVGDLTRLQLADGLEAPVTPATNYESRSKGAADKNYPSEDLENMLKAMSGDAEAAIPIKGMKVGQDVKNRDVTIEPGKITKIVGYATNTVSHFTPLIRFKENGAGIPDADFQFDCYGRTDYNVGVSDWSVTDIQRSDPGFVVASAWENFKGQTVHAELQVDSRDPNMTYFSYECWGYHSTNSHRVYGFFKGHFKNGASPDAFYFSHFTAEPDTEWRVYKD